MTTLGHIMSPKAACSKVPCVFNGASLSSHRPLREISRLTLYPFVRYSYAWPRVIALKYPMIDQEFMANLLVRQCRTTMLLPHSSSMNYLELVNCNWGHGVLQVLGLSGLIGGWIHKHVCYYSIRLKIAIII